MEENQNRPVQEPQPGVDLTSAEASAVAALEKVVLDLKWERVHGYLEFTVPAESLFQASRTARDKLGYSYLSNVTAVDWKDKFEVVYHLYRLDRPQALVFRVFLPREEEPAVPSVTSIWPGAEFQEREAYDLMGIRFVGHPDLRRILMPDDFAGHPLRKDFVVDLEAAKMRHLAYGAEGQLPDPRFGPGGRGMDGQEQ